MKKSLVVVLPVYNEMACLPAVIAALRACADNEPSYLMRFIFVDDGSQDGSLAYLTELAAHSTDIVCVELARNHGHQMAIAAGMAVARDYAAMVVMDADMQDPPSLISAMLRQFEAGHEVVLAERSSRKESGMRRIGMELFHRVLVRFCDFPIAKNVGVYSLLAAPVVELLNQMQERNRYFPAMRSWLGFKVGRVHYQRDERLAGEPKQSLVDLVAEAMNCLFSFSNLPIRAVTYVGGSAMLIGVLLSIYFVAKRLFFHDPAVTGFTTLVCLMVFMAGAQLLSLGLIGHYVSRIHDQVLGRPLYLVRRIHRQIDVATANSHAIDQIEV